MYKKLLERESREVNERYLTDIKKIASMNKEDMETKVFDTDVNIFKMQEMVKYQKFIATKDWNLEDENGKIELTWDNYDTYIQQEDLDEMEKILNPQEEVKKKNSLNTEGK
jgi:hypothetical protein